MNMRMLTGLVCVTIALGLAGPGWAEDTAGAPAANKAGAVYACGDCHVVSTTAGKCPKCEKDLKPAHLLGTKNGEALLCACGPSCGCDAKEAKDGKCGCGKDVKTASAKGLYVCSEGCPEISATPGKCACGKDLVKVE